MKLADRIARAVITALMRSDRFTSLTFREQCRRRISTWQQDHPVPETVRGTYEDRYRVYDRLVTLEGLEQTLDYLEFGVYQGASLRWWLERNQDPESRFYGFDSFEGLPEDWQEGKGKGTFAADGRPPAIDDARCRFQVGWFNSTVPPFAACFERRGRMVLHLDADLYSSTLLVLTSFAPLLAKDDILIFDEFYDCEHEARALLDFSDAYGFDFEMIVGLNGYAKIAMKVA